MTKNDYVIILGDFGGIWAQATSKNIAEENYWLDNLSKRSFTTLFIDGNHENYDRLDAFPVETWNGGKIQKITDSIYHLMRGQVFAIEDKKFFTFGGAASHDIQGGILDENAPGFRKKRRLLDLQNMSYRINHISWWEREMPSQEEYDEGIANLNKVGNNVDFILSHCCPSSSQALISGGWYKPDVLTNYLESIHSMCDFKKWFCGHYHINKNLNERDLFLYEQIIRIN